MKGRAGAGVRRPANFFEIQPEYAPNIVVGFRAP